ncbi:hypothetical protein RB195_017806 [Necator americanus]|uniref:Uncharacterized protein n=1 Tax=Necator americanus TaxID=51031 RepID=A0ABR1C8H1_NECAM
MLTPLIAALRNGSTSIPTAIFTASLGAHPFMQLVFNFIVLRAIISDSEYSSDEGDNTETLAVNEDHYQSCYPANSICGMRRMHCGDI